MIEVPVYNMSGEQTGTMSVDEQQLGGVVRRDLLKQAIVSWLANQRQGSARTKSRGMVSGSGRKLYRQKGTGNARMGTSRTVVRRGGGVAFAKQQRNYRQGMPRKMRQAARNSALLAKLKSQDVVIIDSLNFAEPKTKQFYGLLKSVGAERGCVLALPQPDTVIYKSGRNIPKTEIRPVHELNAYEILRRRKLLFTKEAFEAVVANPQTYKVSAQAG
jgi:large subunit ribosomal protein L4